PFKLPEAEPPPAPASLPFAEPIDAEQPELPTVLPSDPGLLSAERLATLVHGPALPAPGFWGAVGWSSLALFSQFLAGCFIAVALGALRISSPDQLPQRSSWLVSAEVVSGVVMLAVVGLNLRSGTRRALALRGIGGAHLLLV